MKKISYLWYSVILLICQLSFSNYLTAQTTIYEDDFATLSTSVWTIEGGDRWMLTTLQGNPKPAAQFLGGPNPTYCDYDQTLTSKSFSGSNKDVILIDFDLMFNSTATLPYGSITVEQLSLHIYDGSKWNLVHDFDNKNGHIGWPSFIRFSFDISKYAANKDFKVRFQTHGEQIMYFNQWDIDNLKIYSPASTGNLTVNIANCPTTTRSFDMVTLEGANKLIYTGTISGNKCTFMNIPTGSYKMTVDVDGYAHIIKDIVIASGSNNQDATLSSAGNCVAVGDLIDTNKTGLGVELTWTVPASGTVIGYRVYRNSEMISRLTKNNKIVDVAPTEGTYTYGVRAVYDDGKVSTMSNEVSVSFTDISILPFFEDFSLLTFDANKWTRTPLKGCIWYISTEWGKEKPSLQFGSMNKVKDYEHLIQSPIINAKNANTIFLSYDIYLERNHLQSDPSLEEIYVDIFNGTDWIQVNKHDNQGGNFEFQSHCVDITDLVSGKDFNIRFRAKGQQAGRIKRWSIDNIRAYSPVVSSFNAVVRDAVKKLENIEITLTSVENGFVFKTISDANGNASINRLEAGEYMLSSKDDGYCTYKKNITINSGANSVDVLLVKPEINIEKLEYNIVTYPGAFIKENITIGNSGDGDMSWTGFMTPDISDDKTGRSGWSTLKTFNGQTYSECVGTDGVNIYIGKKASSQITYSSFDVYSMDGVFKENFRPTGFNLRNFKDMAYDGQYFYGSDGTNAIHVLDLLNKLYISKITIANSDVKVFHCTYDEKQDAFWVGDASSLYLVNKEGEIVIDKIDVEGVSGSAYDQYSKGGPYLWLFTQTSLPEVGTDYDRVTIRQFDIATKTLTGIVHSAIDLPGYQSGTSSKNTLSSGLFGSIKVSNGKYILMGVVLSTVPQIFEYDIKTMSSWILLNDTHGTIAPGDTATLSIDIDTDQFEANQTATANLRISTMNPNVGISDIKINLKVEGVRMNPPRGLSAAFDDINSVELTWELPDSQIEPLGYNVYANNIKVNDEVISELKYIHINPSIGKSCYSVSAVYNNLGESRKTDDKCVVVYSEGHCDAPWYTTTQQVPGKKEVIIKWIDPHNDFLNIQWHGDSPSKSTGLSGLGTLYTGIKFEPADLPQTGDYYIAKIQTFFAQKSYPFIEIYQDDIKIHSMYVNRDDIKIGGLPTLIEIDGGLKVDLTKSLMIVVAGTQLSSGGQFMLDDSSPTIEGKGNLISIDGINWTTASTSSISGNWATTLLLKRGVSSGTYSEIGDRVLFSNNCIKDELVVESLESLYIHNTSKVGDSELAGYNIYRNGTKINNSVVTSTNFTDKYVSVGDNTYSIKAIYNDGCLSAKSNESVIDVVDLSILPFFEEFSSRDLITSGWETTPSIGSSWNVETSLGFPAPAVRFYSPDLKNYNQLLTSRELNAISIPNVYLTFDLNNRKSNNGDTENLYIELLIDGNIIEIGRFDCSQEHLYEKQMFNISEHVIGKRFKFRFRAEGIDTSVRLSQWEIDNIYVNSINFVSANINVTNGSNSISGADILLTSDKQFRYSGRTNENGAFIANNVSADNYSVRIEKSGYNTLYQQITVNGDTPVNTFNFTMTPHGTVNGPTNLKLLKVVGTGVHLKWTNSSTDAIRRFNIYRNGEMVGYTNLPTLTEYLDIVPNEGEFTYEVRTEFADGRVSKPSNSIKAQVKNLDKLPIFEDFEYGSFLPNAWVADSDIWSCPSNMGDPAPAARFGLNGNSELKNYSISLTSKEFAVGSFKNLMLMFDMALVIRNLNTDEYLSIELLNNGNWIELAKFSNKTTVSTVIGNNSIYRYHVVDLSKYLTDERFKIRFRAHGQDARNVLSWHVDNISIKDQKLGELAGKITVKDGSPLSNVLISLNNPTQKITLSTMSDENGNYSLKSVLPGNYQITATKYGFADSKLEKIVKGGTNNLDITILKPEAKITPENIEVKIPYVSTASKVVEIENIGDGLLTWELVNNTKINSWISISANSGQVESGKKQIVRLNVNSIGCNLGEQKSCKYTLIFNSGQSIELNVNMTVENDAEECNAPMLSTCKGDIGNNVRLEWKSAHNSNQDVNLKWHNDTIEGAWGLGVNAGTFYVGAKWDQTDLKYYEGYKIKEVTFYIKDYADIEIQAYQDGQLVLSQPVPGLDIKVKDFNTIAIRDGGFNIDITKELIIGYKATQTALMIVGKYPAGRDGGPAIRGKGDLYSSDGVTWTTLGDMGIVANWYITAKIGKEHNSGKTISMSDLAQTDIEKMNNLYTDQLLSNNTISHKSSKENAIAGYNVYRNGVMVNQSIVTTPYFINNDVPYGIHEYYVTALWSDGCESNPSNRIDIDIKNNYICAIPTNVKGTQKEVNSLIGNIRWDEPTDKHEIKWWDETTLMAIGLGSQEGTLYCGAIWAPTDLTDYDLYTIEEIQIGFGDGLKTVSILVYEDGYLVHEQFVKDNILEYNQINSIKLNKQIVVDANKSLMIAYKAYVPANKGALFYTGIGGENGCLLSTNGSQWTTLDAATGGKADGNWVISAILSLKEQATNNQVKLSNERISTSKHMLNMSKKWSSDIEFTTHKASFEIPGLLGYNIYRDDVLLNTDELITTRQYADSVASFNEYTYHVTAVYKDGCESAPSGKFKLDYVYFNSVTTLDTDDINVYPNPCTDKLHIEGDYKTVSILSIDGKVIETHYAVNGQITINTSSYKSGIYLIRFETESRIINKKVIKM